MATSDQIKLLLKLRAQKGNLLYKMPRPILEKLIGGYHKSHLYDVYNQKVTASDELKIIFQLPIYNKPHDLDKNHPSVIEEIKKNDLEVQSILGSILEKNPAAEINILLHYIAFGNVDKVKEMLLYNPELLLKSGDVILPSEDIVLCVAPYECVLGCGDHYDDMHTIFDNAFHQIKDGEIEKQRQYARYKPYIDNIMQDNQFMQKAYDFNWIIDVIKKRPLIEVQLALNKCFEVDTPLNKALAKFRNDFSPRVIKTPCIYFNYKNLHTLLKLLHHDEWSNLIVSSDNHNCYDKCYLVWRQLVGYLMRSLPACDLQAYAEGLLMHNVTLKRSFSCKATGDSVFTNHFRSSFSGLGFDFALDIFGGMPSMARWSECGYVDIEVICRTKSSTLQNLCQHDNNRMKFN